MKATLKHHRQSPRKTRLVADLIRGKSVSAARRALLFLPKKSAPAVSKLLDSALANARQLGLAQEDLVVRSITVDKDSVLKRFAPMARGRSAGFRSTMSTIRLELGRATPEKRTPRAASRGKTEEK